MRLYLSCDMEGAAGIIDWDYCIRGKLDYKEGRELLMGEVNSAIEAALEAGAKEIVINDSHDGMVNLLPSQLHPQAKLLSGRVKTLSMMEGIDSGFDGAIFIAYHSGAGTYKGTLSHTYTSAIHRLKINDKVLGEPGLNAALAGYFKVPLIFLSGDKAATEEIKALVPDIITVAVKEAIGRKSALCISPQLAREKIKQGVKEAVKKITQIKPLQLPAPYLLEAEVTMPDMADLCQRIPGLERKDGLTLIYRADDFLELYKAFLTIMSLSSSLL